MAQGIPQACGGMRNNTVLMRIVEAEAKASFEQLRLQGIAARDRKRLNVEARGGCII